MKKILVVSLTIFSLFVLSGCDKKETKKEENKVEENETNNNIDNNIDNEQEELENEEENEQNEDSFTIEDDYLINNRTREKYEIVINLENISYDVSEIKGLYVIRSEKGYGIYNENEKLFIEPKYMDVSCLGHSDESYHVCTINSDMTILTDDNNMKLINLKNGKEVLSGEKIRELPNGKFIVKKDNNEIIYNINLKEFLKANYIGYSEQIGYITITNNEYNVYDEEFKKIDLPDINQETIILTNDNNIFVEGDVIAKIDIKNNKYFKYDGDEVSGTKVVLVDPCREKNTYILENNKAIKLDNIVYKSEGGEYICH